MDNQIPKADPDIGYKARLQDAADELARAIHDAPWMIGPQEIVNLIYERKVALGL